MRSVLFTLLGILLCGLAASCGSGITGGGDPYYASVRIVADVQLTPAEVHAGQTVLVDYTLGRVQVKAPGGVSYADVSFPPNLTATAGEALPLLESVYAPGGALPAPEAVRTALGSGYPLYQGNLPFEGVVRANDHVYVMFVAPATPGPATLKFWLGGGGGPSSPKSSRTLTIDVLPAP